MTVRIIHGDARRLLLDDETVDLVVTSPPFLNLRSYTDGGAHYDGQIGVGTRDQFLQDLWDVTAEMARVLKPTGSIWVELGDSYTNKSLNLSPHRYAIGCVDKLGLILRAEVIWQRPNGLPESVTDRVRRSHSVWFHLVKQPRYYSAVDHIRQPHIDTTTKTRTWEERKAAGVTWTPGLGTRGTHLGNAGAPNTRMAGNPLGALPGSVWEVPTEPFQAPPELGVDHFAAMPMTWPRRIILGWSPAGICTTCGEGRRPVVDRKPMPAAAKRHAHRSGSMLDGSRGDAGRTNSGQEFNRWRAANPELITGEVCGCPDTTAPTRPAVVLDPFSGTGTTALVAHALGRDGIGVDMSADYCRLAEWRTSDPGQIAKAMGVPRPPKELDGQASALDLLTELDGGAA